MAWDDTQTATDSITHTEWNAMVTYVKNPDEATSYSIDIASTPILTVAATGITVDGTITVGSYTLTIDATASLTDFLQDITSESLGDLSNVTEDSPADNDVLQYVTDHWENQTLAEAGIVAVALADISGASWVIDEDNLASNLDTKVPTQQSVKAYADLMLPLSGGTMSGDLTCADKQIIRAKMKDTSETVKTVASSGAALTLNMEDGNVHDVTLSAACTLTFSNPIASGSATSFTLLLRQDATGSRAVTWPASVEWNAGITPTLLTAEDDVDMFSFFTVDGGTTWYGFHIGYVEA